MNAPTNLNAYRLRKMEFLILCGTYLIDPLVALEDQGIKNALKNGTSLDVEKILQENF